LATDIADFWRRAIELNSSYYRDLGEMSNAYLSSLSELFSTLSTGGLPLRTVSSGKSGEPARVAPMPPPAAPAMVLEGPTGADAVGAFVVTNHSREPVTATMKASPFRSENGNEIAPTLKFDPAVVTLAPNEQALVRIAARIDGDLEVDIGYRGDISAEGLPGVAAPFVLRRRPSPAPERPGRASSPGSKLKSSKKSTTPKRRGS
jgi:hypothetical protein